MRTINPRCPLLVAANKTDLMDPFVQADRLGELASWDPVAAAPLAASALTGSGLEAVRRAIRDSVHLQAARGGQALGLHRRQKECLLAAARSAEEAAGLLDQARDLADRAELVAVELRSALGALGQISGQVTDEDILARIFARFCVGK